MVAGATKIKKGELAEKKTWGWDGVRVDRAAATFGEGGILQVGELTAKSVGGSGAGSSDLSRRGGAKIKKNEERT